MKFFTVLLFASLATASLAVLPGSEDEIHMKTQHTSATSQSIPTSHNSKESTSNKDSSIFREQLVSKDNVVIECTKSKSQKAQTGASQLEETTGPTTSAETTTEGKLTKLNQAIEKKLDKIIGKLMSSVKDIIPGTSDITSQ
uniref:Glycosylation-dependent cell adhesion molecule 1 n=1 Tax=Peromyscus maniculatus bairdii TaxID=230844 RepID=A0A6J0DIW9_PERMB|nr:glycosylation-dependent cell adhesion molecule 1-like isoform X1 [Peromyscus maniculatus bairdii]